MSVSITINFSDNASAPKEEWWLTVEQSSGDDRITVQDAAEILDTLYDIDPCIAEEYLSEEEAPAPTEEDLTDTMAGVDMEQCKLLMSGDYTTELTIIKSHPEEPHKLILSIGEAAAPVITQFNTVQTMDIKTATSIRLPYPVLDPKELTAIWRGTVYGKSGAIAPPALKYAHNTIYWDTTATGTIRASYPTQHELVEVTVPGLKEYQEDPTGDPQASNALIFYHYQTYQADIEPPVREEGWDAELTIICGKKPSSKWKPEAEPEEPEDPEAQEPEDPCVDKYEGTGLVCCDTKAPPPCMEWLAGEVPQKELSPETQAAYKGANFIALPVDPVKGCGRLYKKYDLSMTCCDHVEPITAHPDNPTEISSDSSVIMCINGGGPILTWEAGGGLYFHDSYGNHVTTIETNNPHPACIQVYSPEEFCENSKVQVEDGCTQVSMNLRKPDSVPLMLCEEGSDIVVAPNAYVSFLPTGGVPPYTGWSSDGLIHQGGGIFLAPDDFCGTADVTVMDSCLEEATCTVRSTEGTWILYCEQCCPPGPGNPDPLWAGAMTGGGFAYSPNIFVYGGGSADCLGLPEGYELCPGLPHAQDYCEDMIHGEWEVEPCTTNCCKDSGGRCTTIWSNIGPVYKWSCNE